MDWNEDDFDEASTPTSTPTRTRPPSSTCSKILSEPESVDLSRRVGAERTFFQEEPDLDKTSCCQT